MVELVPLLVFLTFVGFILVLAGGAHRRRRRWVADCHAALASFAAELGGRLSLQRSHAVSGAELVGGAWEGRGVHVRLSAVSRRGFEVRLGVRLDVGIDLTIKPASLGGKLLRAFGVGGLVRTGSRDVDERLLVSTSQGGEAAEVFSHGGQELLAVLSQVLERSDADAGVVAQGGWLYLDATLPELDPRYMRWLLGRLREVARHYERKVVRVTVRAVEVERFGWTGGGLASRCPYCREEVAAADLGLVACDDCHTLHHAECFAEHGGCTIFGCGGRRQEVLA